jgi:hypothetical protein
LSNRLSLESLLDDLGHLNVDDENLLQEHIDYLVFVQIVVPLNVFDLGSNLGILSDQLLIVVIATLLLPFVLLFQLFLVSVDLSLGVCVGITHSLGPLYEIKYGYRVTFG